MKWIRRLFKSKQTGRRDPNFEKEPDSNSRAELKDVIGSSDYKRISIDLSPEALRRAGLGEEKIEYLLNEIEQGRIPRRINLILFIGDRSNRRETSSASSPIGSR